MLTPDMEAILNEVTKTVHTPKTGTADLHADCGVTHHLDPDQLRTMPVTKAVSDHDAIKCGRCFEDGRGY